MEKYILLSDDELIYMIKMGNEEALELLFFRYEIIVRRIYYKNKRLLGASWIDEDDMNMLLRKTLLEAVETYNFTLSAFYPFFNNLFQKRVYSLIRTNNRQLEYIDPQYELKEDLIMYSGGSKLFDNSLEIENHMLIKEVEELLLKTDKKSREIFIMWFKGYKYSEIGETFNISPKTVQARITKTLKYLRGYLVSAYR